MRHRLADRRCAWSSFRRCRQRLNPALPLPRPAAPNQSITAAPKQSIVKWIGNNVVADEWWGDNDMLTESASTADAPSWRCSLWWYLQCACSSMYSANDFDSGFDAASVITPLHVRTGQVANVVRLFSRRVFGVYNGGGEKTLRLVRVGVPPRPVKGGSNVVDKRSVGKGRAAAVGPRVCSVLTMYMQGVMSLLKPHIILVGVGVGIVALVDGFKSHQRPRPV